ncbi:MAG: PDZ domain-containing protein, partial [Bacteroidales bacterium]|nr:PDZ domain-containing protein [Bacteroidales bacterium]
GRYRPGDKVKVTVDRDGKNMTFTVELQNAQGSTDIVKTIDGMDMLGATFGDISDSNKQKLGIRSGVEVTDVDSSGKFRKEGINKGFIILRINNAPVNSEEDITKIVQMTATSTSEDKVILIAGFYPNNKTQYIAIDLSNK